MTPETPDFLNQIGSGLSVALINMVAAMLTPEIGFLAVISLMVTQGVKSILIYVHKSPPAELIWFVIGPLGTAVPAKFIWTLPAPHWLAAACAASLIANLAYALFLKRLLGRLAPTAYERLNVPFDRRKTEQPPPAGQAERRGP